MGEGMTEEEEYRAGHAALSRIFEKASGLQEALGRMQWERDALSNTLNNTRDGQQKFWHNLIMKENPIINLLNQAITHLGSVETCIQNANNHLSDC